MSCPASSNSNPVSKWSDLLRTTVRWDHWADVNVPQIRHIAKADRSLLAVRRAFLGEWIHKPDVLGLSWGSLWTHRGFDCGRADEAGIGGVSAGLTKRQVKIVEISMNSAPAKKRA